MIAPVGYYFKGLLNSVIIQLKTARPNKQCLGLYSGVRELITGRIFFRVRIGGLYLGGGTYFRRALNAEVFKVLRA